MFIMLAHHMMMISLRLPKIGNNLWPSEVLFIGPRFDQHVVFLLTQHIVKNMDLDSIITFAQYWPIISHYVWPAVSGPTLAITISSGSKVGY